MSLRSSQHPPDARARLRLLPRLPFTEEQWRRRTEWPVTVAALVFLAAYAWSVIGDLTGGAWDAAEWVMWTIWLVFVVDFVVNLLLAERRAHWFLMHLPQFLVVVLPMLRPLRLLRLITLWGTLQRAAGAWMRGRAILSVIGSAALLILIASLAELEAERHAGGAHITDFGRALWWAFETITTVGYGDETPVTFAGRTIAIGLMIAGIGLLGVVTATLASWMVERMQVSDRADATATVAHIDALAAQVQALSDQLAALGHDPRGAAAPVDGSRRHAAGGGPTAVASGARRPG